MSSEVENTSVEQENVSVTTEEKEKICKFFNSKRGCVKGENCDFLHIKIDKKKNSKNNSEKRNNNKSENKNNENNEETKDSKKTKKNNKKDKRDKINDVSEENGNKKICKFFNTPEGCKKGDKCQFLHIKAEIDNSLEESTKSNKNNKSNNRNNNKNNNKNNKNNRDKKDSNDEKSSPKDEKPPTANNDGNNQTIRISYPKNFNNSTRKPVARPQPRISENKSERDIEIDQLERRYRETFKVVETIPAYSKVAFDFSPTDPDFPFELESMNVELLIPMTYPIGACKMTKITNNDIPPHLINNIITTFNRKANIKPRLPLVNLMNWLDFNLEDLLINKPPEPSVVISFVSNTKKPEDETKKSETDSKKEKKENENDDNEDDDNDNDNDNDNDDDDDNDNDNDEDEDADNSVDLNDIDFDNQISDDDDDDEDDDQDALYSENKNNNLTHGYEEVNEEDDDVDIEEGDENENVIRPTALSSDVPKGIHIRLPNIKITGISLLQCVGLSLTLKCNRCRNTIDFYEVRPMGQLKLKSTKENDSKKEEEKPYIVNSVYWKHCKTCRQAIGIRYRSEYLTPFSLAIGYIDLEGCIPFDFLPSNFVIQCDRCNTDQPAINGVKRSQDNDVFCKKCYNHMVLNVDLIKYVKFAQTEKLDDEGLPSATRIKLRKKKEKEQSLGIILGQPLPNRGVCEHYKKSYRWFRFPCCGKIFPCDICHDNHSDHEAKWANRMICGFCSKEQPFSDKDCSCGKSLTKKAVSHWEGGKGNRDSTTMNKRDKQKYSGMNKTVSRKAQKKMDAKKSKKNKK